MECLENILDGVDMYSFQNLGVEKVLQNKEMLLGFDTGTGKTITYSVIVRALLNRNPDKKHILVIIHDSLEQIPRVVRELTRVPVVAYSGTQEDYYKLKRQWEQTSIIILTLESFRNPRVVKLLYSHIIEVESFTIDEAHHVSTWDSSDTAFMIRALAQYAPYTIGLSATPITSYRAQYFQLMNLISRDLSSHARETSLNKYNEKYLPVNRIDYEIKGDYVTTLEIVDPMLHQLGHIRGIISRVIKGSGAVNQVERLISVVQNRLSQGKKIIVYLNYHDSREWVEENFSKAGISFTSLHGRMVKRADREASLNRYKSGEVNVLITSVSESLNIDSDVVVFYEFTTKLKQVMGRAHRGLEAKLLELVFIVTKDTEEVEYFLTYIYERSLIIQKLLRKDYSELIKIGEALKALNLGD